MSSFLVCRRLGRSKSLNYSDVIRKHLIQEPLVEENALIKGKIGGFVHIQIISGWISLFKKRPWVLLFCTLDENHFTICKTRNYETMLRLDLQSVKCLKFQQKKKHKTKKQLCKSESSLIELKFTEKTLRLKFETDEEMNRWLSFLLKYLNKVKVEKSPKVEPKKLSQNDTNKALKKSKSVSIQMVKRRKKFRSKLTVEEKNFDYDQPDYVVTESAKKFFSIRTGFSPELFRRRAQFEEQQVETIMGENNSPNSIDGKEKHILNETFVIDSKRSSIVDDTKVSESSSRKMFAPLYSITWTKSSKKKSEMKKKSIRNQSSKRSIISLKRSEYSTMKIEDKEEKVELFSSENEKYPGSLTEEFTQYLNSVFDINLKSQTLTVVNSWIDDTQENGDNLNTLLDEIPFQNIGDGDKKSTIFLNTEPIEVGLIQKSFDYDDFSTPNVMKKDLIKSENCSHFVSSDEDSVSKLFNSYSKIVDITSLCKSYRKGLSLEDIKEKEKILDSGLKKRLSFPTENLQTSIQSQVVNCQSPNNVEHTSFSQHVIMPVISCKICR